MNERYYVFTMGKDGWGWRADCFDRLQPLFASKTLSAGRYVVFTYHGTFANLLKTYQYIFGTWLSRAKEELNDREEFAVYEHKVLSFDDPNNEVKIFIPTN